MKKLIFALVAMLLLSSYNNSSTKNTLFYWKLKGKVKTLIRHNYDFKVVDGKVVKGEPSGTINGHYSVAFNKAGNYTEYVNYSLDGKISAKEKFTRNDQGYLVEWSRDWPVDSLDERGEISYDSEGNRIETIEYNTDGTIKSRVIKKFDKAGNSIVSTKYKSDGSIEWRDENNFDENRNWLSSNRYNADKELTRKQWSINNNEHGNWLEATVHKIEGDVKTEYRATYKYDKQGNWTEFVIYKDGDSSVMIIRELTYY